MSAGFDWGIAPSTPLGPRSVVHRHIAITEQIQREDQGAGAGAGAAGSNDWLRKVDAALLEQRTKLRLRKDRAVGSYQPGEGQIHAPGQVAGADAGTGF